MTVVGITWSVELSTPRLSTDTQCSLPFRFVIVPGFEPVRVTVASEVRQRVSHSRCLRIPVSLTGVAPPRFGNYSSNHHNTMESSCRYTQRVRCVCSLNHLHIVGLFYMWQVCVSVSVWSIPSRCVHLGRQWDLNIAQSCENIFIASGLD